jgi:hypothetical protein
LRESRGLTVRDVAKLTGLPISTLGGYFAGRHLPPLKPVGFVFSVAPRGDGRVPAAGAAERRSTKQT